MPVSQPPHTGQFPDTNLRRAYINKCIAMSALLIVLWLLNLFVSRDVLALPASLVIGLMLLPNAAVAVWPGDASDTLLGLSVGADVTAATAGIHFGGGVDMVSGPLFYVGVIALAGLIVSERAAFFATGGSALAYGLLVWAEYTGVLLHRVSYTRPPDRQVTTVIMVGLCLFLVTWVVLHTIRLLRAQYRRVEELRTEAVSALSHDLKNPLGIIHSYAQMAEAATATERTDYLRRVQAAAQQALDLVSNVLDTAAVDARPLTAEREPLDLNALVEQVCDLYHFAADAKNIQLSTALAPRLPSIAADPQLLRRAIGNLLSNAIKYTPPEGTVEIATGAASAALVVTVRDTGCGIPSAAVPRLFQKYSRASSNHGVEGTGLGLYIVRCIAEAHGGSVSVDSKVDKGSVFTLRLPHLIRPA